MAEPTKAAIQAVRNIEFRLVGRGWSDPLPEKRMVNRIAERIDDAFAKEREAAMHLAVHMQWALEYLDWSGRAEERGTCEVALAAVAALIGEKMPKKQPTWWRCTMCHLINPCAYPHHKIDGLQLCSPCNRAYVAGKQAGVREEQAGAIKALEKLKAKRAKDCKAPVEGGESDG